MDATNRKHHHRGSARRHVDYKEDIPVTYGDVHDEEKPLVEGSGARSTFPWIVDVQLVKATPFPERLVEGHAQHSIILCVHVGVPLFVQIVAYMR